MMNTEDFIKKSQSVHGDKYLYTKTIFKDWKTLVNIICSRHMDFYQMPLSHIRGHGCKKCSVEFQALKRSEKAAAEFETKARAVHGSKYDYSKVKYKNAHTLIDIICDIHEVFTIRPYAHLQGSGCMKCGNLSTAKKKTTSPENYIQKAKKKHKEKYDYTKTKYVKSCEFVLITCPEHGDFSIRAGNHLNGQGCPECGEIKRADSRRDTKEDFVEKANKVHNNRYDYTLTVYKGAHVQVITTCPGCGPFKQKPSDHIGSKSGCPLCVDQLNSRGVKRIESFLLEQNYKFIREKTFPSLKSTKTGNKSFRFDFYLQEHDILIEFDGMQHFKSIAKWGGEKTYQALRENDALKNEWAQVHGYKLIRIKYTDEDKIEEILSKNLP
jgi:very-short-patch-repair endonuclease/protein-arginine kinase activator protein McsA